MLAQKIARRPRSQSRARPFLGRVAGGRRGKRDGWGGVLSVTTLTNGVAITNLRREPVGRIVSHRPAAPRAELWTRLWTPSVGLHIVLKRVDFWRRECARIRTVAAPVGPRGQATDGRADGPTRSAQSRVSRLQQNCADADEVPQEPNAAWPTGRRGLPPFTISLSPTIPRVWRVERGHARPEEEPLVAAVPELEQVGTDQPPADPET